MRIVLLVFVLVCVGLVTSGLGQKATKRDIAKYDDGGSTDFGWNVMADHKIRGSRLRDFIWTHFNEKRLGHIRAAFYSIEGDPVFEHIFIEPDSKGNWQISIESERHCCWFYGMEKPRKRRTVTRWSEVYLAAERTEATYKDIGRSPDSVGGEVLAVDDLRPATKYRLVLKRTVSSDIVRNF